MREGRARKRKERIAIVRAHLPGLGIDPASERGQSMLQALERLEGKPRVTKPERVERRPQRRR